MGKEFDPPPGLKDVCDVLGLKIGSKLPDIRTPA